MAKRKNPERDPCNDMEVRCYGCGKMFIPAPEHVYKEDEKPVCTWTCLCSLRRRKEQKRRSRENVSPVEMLDQEGKHITFFPSARAAGEALGVDPAGIRDVCAGRQMRSAGYRWRWAEGSPAEKRAIIKTGCILQSYGDAKEEKERGK